MATTVLGVKDLLDRLKSVERELENLAPAPRVHLDRAATLAMVKLSRKCIEDLSKVQ